MNFHVLPWKAPGEKENAGYSPALFVLGSSMAVHEHRHARMYEQDYKQQWALGVRVGLGRESSPEQSLVGIGAETLLPPFGYR